MKKKCWVRDRWWPFRIGCVVKRFASGDVLVKWIDGEAWRYDRAHAKKFLEQI